MKSRVLELLCVLCVLCGWSQGCASADEVKPLPGATRPDAATEALLARFRDYVYATYDIEFAGRGDAKALDRLRAARESLGAAMREAGLAAPEGGSLGGVVHELKDHFLAHGDFIFVPLGQESGGVLLVRAAE